MVKTDSLIKISIGLLSLILGFGATNKSNYVEVDYEPYKDKRIVVVNGQEEEIETLSITKLNEANEDVIGIVKIDGVIEEPFVQGKDNEEYLRKNLSLQQVSAGVSFMDYRSNFDNQNVIIYGHSSRYQENILFTPLLGYRNYDFYVKHPLIKIEINDEERVYEIVSVFFFDVDGGEPATFTKQSWSKQAMMISDLHALKDKSLYDTGVEIETDQFLTLVTCNTEIASERMIIIAQKKN